MPSDDLVLFGIGEGISINLLGEILTLTEPGVLVLVHVNKLDCILLESLDGLETRELCAEALNKSMLASRALIVIGEDVGRWFSVIF